MNTILWWLESPWQLRALVFILSFFVCFVGPWLHNQSVLTSRLLAKKLHDQYHGTVLAPKAEGLLASGQGAAPASEEHAPAEGKAALQPPPVPAQQEAIAAQAPVEATVPAQAAPAIEEHPAVPAAAQLQEGPPPQQVPAAAAPAPAVEDGNHDQAQAAPSPDIEAPAPQNHAPVASPGQIEKAPAPAEPNVPAKQEQAEIQPAAPAAPASQFNIVDRGARAATAVPADRPAGRQDFAISTASGGSADVEVYALHQSRDTRNFAILDSDAFRRAAAHYAAFVCAGFAPDQNVTRAKDGGPVQLCRVLAHKPYVPANAKLYGLPLSEKETAPRSLAIIGVKNAKGDLADPALQKKMISDIIRSGKIARFPAGNAAKTGPENDLQFIEMTREPAGHETRPVRKSGVKRAYSRQSKGEERNFPVVHPAVYKRNKAYESTRHLAKHDQKVRHSHPVVETRASKTHGCGLFDFPF